MSVSDANLPKFELKANVGLIQLLTTHCPRCGSCNNFRHARVLIIENVLTAQVFGKSNICINCGGATPNPFEKDD